jgi:uncharacterized Zn finger protein (UPF0148 family)
MSRESNATTPDVVPCPVCQAPQGVRTSKTQANPDRQVANQSKSTVSSTASSHFVL